MKVLTRGVSRHPRAVAVFHDEARLMARLHHPWIVGVHDLGQIEHDFDDIAAGSPYMAMDLVDGSSLSGWRGRLPWLHLRSCLLRLLRALAYAHARGVIHRDLKPQNVVVSRDLRVLKLTDFGIARHLDRDADGTDRELAGTPAFLAPEQIDLRWRDLGPWTDLYGLGCLAYTLAAGSAPFRSDSGGPFDVMEQQLHAPPPALPSGAPVPPGFQGWLHRLLRKDPTKRFQRAADAERALQQLGGGPVVEIERSVGDWRRGEVPLTSRPLSPTVFRLRTVPFVGRVAERDAVWSALQRVSREGRARAVVLRGPTGYGKSRLAEWVAERAHELGVADVMRARHAEFETRAQGLVAMLQRAMRTGGLKRREVERRVRAHLEQFDVRDPDDLAALSEVVSPAPTDSTPGTLRITSLAEFYTVVARYVTWRAARRPQVVWLDDVHHGPRAVDFARLLLDAQAVSPSPVLVLLTVQSEALAEREAVARQLDALLERDDVGAVDIGALDDAHRPALFQALGGLGDEAARRIDRRTAGNPQFAVQLVGDWVERGRLHDGWSGDDALPRDVHEVWAARVERFLEGRPRAERYALELAAALGLDVDAREWAAVCAAAKVVGSEALVEALLVQSLAQREPGAKGGGDWAFVHGMLRESVERLAAEAGRRDGWHRLCAEALAVRGADPERVGRHRLAAGDDAAAIDPLLDAAQMRLDEGDNAAFGELLGAAERALDAMAAPREDASHGRVAVMRCRGTRFVGDYDGAERLAREAEETALEHGWVRVRTTALVELGSISADRGAYGLAERRLLEAMGCASVLGDAQLMAQARVRLSRVYLGRGQLQAAEGSLRRARAEFEALGDPMWGARCSDLMGRVLTQAGRMEEAWGCIREARELAERAGSRRGMAALDNALGEHARLRGDLDAAERHYRDALRRWDALAMGTDALVGQVNLGLVDLLRGRFAEARARFEAALPHLAREGVRAAVHAGLLNCAAGLGEWDAFDRHRATAAALVARCDLTDLDIAHAARTAGELAGGAGRPGRARAALELAAQQYAELDRADALAAVHAQLSALAA